MLATNNGPLRGSAETSLSGADLNRRVLTLIGGVRLLIAAALVLVAVFQPEPKLLGQQYPVLFVALACVYCLAALVIALILRGSQWNISYIAWLQLAADITCITLMIHASGGIGTGLELLLVIFVLASGMTLPARSSYFAAALGALAILGEQSLSFLRGFTDTAQFVPAGLTGATMLAVTVVIQPLIRLARETEELARKQSLDLANLAQLNEYIIQNLRESIIVVDEKRTIRLINQAAIELLGLTEPHHGERLRSSAAAVAEQLDEWEQSPHELPQERPGFLAPDEDTLINAHFAPLGNQEDGRGPVLIFLEDASLLADKVQQSKLAALGRLSASIAHEIRNPLGALSHAGQLLGESPGLGDQDRRFIDIIRTNANRVSDIVENILQLSRKDSVKPQILQLDEWCKDFVNEFVTTLELFEGQLHISSGTPVEILMDPGHLHQVTWNLCENAMKYASEAAGAIAIELSYGRHARNGRPYLEISDHGPGIAADMEESIFEPFATGNQGGTGLGLYICRELCERNGGTLRYRARAGGGSVFQIVFSDPERWEKQA